MRNSLVTTLILATAVTACSSDKTPRADSTATPTAGSSATATPAAAAPATPGQAAVTISSPAKGATTGTDVTVTLRSTGVTIAKADGKKVEGIGHYHLFLDTATTPDNAPIPPGTKKIVHIGTGDSTYTFKGLPAGKHRLIAVIGYGDHSPMPGGRDTVTFVVKK